MSSPSDTDSENTPIPLRADSLLQGGQGGHNDQGNVRLKRNMVNQTLYQGSGDPTWAQREPHGHNAATSSSSSSRALPPNQMDSTRYSAAPFPMSDMPPEARRQSIMAMDRKRRLTGSTYDSGGRRRTVGGGFNERDEVQINRSPDFFPSGSRLPGTSQRHRFGPGSSAEVIDLTTSPPQVATSVPAVPRRSSTSTSGVYVVPRWQPDSEVSECSICKRPFTFLFRRHHCRKCGRVVCNECSPHRITIPRQFIVNPPGPSTQSSSVARETVDLTGDDDNDNDNTRPTITYNASRQQQLQPSAGLGGGEKVRLCNPCVPDPQPEPESHYASATLPLNPRGRRDDLLTLSDALRSSRQDFHHQTPADPFPGFAPQQTFSYINQPSRARPLAFFPHPRGGSEQDASNIGQFPFPSNDRYRHRGHLSFDSPQPMQHRHPPLETSRMPPQNATRPRGRSMLDESYLPRMFPGQMPSLRPRVNEEDICPICRRMLPPKGPEGDESARETHIIDCISARDPSSYTGSNRGLSGSQSQSQAQFRGPMHMLPFIATEKDCVGEDGNVPECSICMVEYDVGDELARLECLCKFHRECISEWFTRKQECPVHKIT